MFLVGLSASFMPYLMVVLVALVWVGNSADVNLADSQIVANQIEVAHQVEYQPSIQNTISYHEAQQQLGVLAISSSQPSLFQEKSSCEQWGFYTSDAYTSYSGVSLSLRAPPAC
jgi:hypothetical protein